jgi:hypothetical protein
LGKLEGIACRKHFPWQFSKWVQITFGDLKAMQKESKPIFDNF